MPNIYDNTTDTTRLGPALRKSLVHFDTVDIATGYIDLRGWSDMADILDSKTVSTEDGPAARVLVGMVAPADSKQLLDSLQDDVQVPKPGSDVHDLESALVRRDQLVAHLRTQLMRGLATSAGQATLQTLKQQLRDGVVAMRVFTEKPLHGKTYIFHAPEDGHLRRWAYVGSSNLTGAGLHRNLELNIDVQDSDATLKLAGWFDERWDDRFSLDITAEIIELIEESWADQQQPTPFEVYLKVCHSLSQDARDGMGYVLPKSMSDLLLDYQESAVRTLSRRIVRRGGTMLGDVVGLGKTLTAVATALMLQAAEDYSTLVLCPKNLQGMWEQHVEEYDISGRVVPYSMVDKVLPELKRFNLVICDESHNLRNNNTVAYEVIQSYIRSNGSKVLLLTATPYNLAFTDVANQIGLYIDEDQDLGIVPTEALRRDPTLSSKVDGKITTLLAFKRSEEAEDWRRLMSDHLVRRTRSFIKRTASTETVVGPDGAPEEREYLEFANGQKFHFPTRIATPLSHAFAEHDPAGLMEEDHTLDAIQNLILARYRLADYDNPRAKHTAEDVKHLDDIRSGRGNVSGFVRVGLFKRMSSSGHSFILSLQRQRARNELFIHAIDHGLPLPLGSHSDKQMAVSDQDVEGGSDEAIGATHYDALVSALPPNTKWLNSTVLKPSLKKDLVTDNETITGLLDQFGNWDPQRDSKVNALIDLLAEEHPGEKVLVFTEYSDTARYVARALTEAGVANVGLATGDTKDIADVTRRFSPHSNDLPNQRETAAVEGGDQINILVATDVLSEGQNLQDSHIIVNYDLPWAIIRIIQRAGRVDRIGQRSDTVNVYLITHEKIEQQLNLRKRIKARLGASAEAFGSDERFFGGDEEIKILDDFYKGRVTEGDGDEEAEAEADSASEAWLAWSNAQKQFPEVTEKVLRMQDMVHTTRGLRLNEKESVTCYVATASGVDAFATSTGTGTGVEEKILTPIEALRIFRADPDTPTAARRPDHFEREQDLVQGTLKSESIVAGNLKGIRKWAWTQVGGTVFGQRAPEALEALHSLPLTEHASMRLTLARRHKYCQDDIIDLLNQLHDEDRLVIGGSDTDAIRIVCSLGVRDA